MKNLNKNNKKEGITFMDTKDRQILYSSIGFLGGLISMNMILPQETLYRTFFIIVGGLCVAIVGNKMATR